MRFLVFVFILASFNSLFAQSRCKIGQQYNSSNLKFEENLSKYELLDALELDNYIFSTFSSGVYIHDIDVYKRSFLPKTGYLFKLDSNLSIVDFRKIDNKINTSKTRYIGIYVTDSILNYLYLSLNTSGDSCFVIRQQFNSSMVELKAPEVLHKERITCKNFQNVNCRFAQSKNKRFIVLTLSCFLSAQREYEVNTIVFDERLGLKKCYPSIETIGMFTESAFPLITNLGNVVVLSQLLNGAENMLRLRKLFKTGNQSKDFGSRLYIHSYNILDSSKKVYDVALNDIPVTWHVSQDLNGQIYIAYNKPDAIYGRVVLVTVGINNEGKEVSRYEDINVKSFYRVAGDVVFHAFTGLHNVDSSLFYMFEDLALMRIESVSSSVSTGLDTVVSKFELWDHSGGELIVIDRFKPEYQIHKLTFSNLTSPSLVKISSIELFNSKSKVFLTAIETKEFFYLVKGQRTDTIIHKVKFENSEMNKFIVNEGAYIREISTLNCRLFCSTRKKNLQFASINYQ